MKRFINDESGKRRDDFEDFNEEDEDKRLHTVIVPIQIQVIQF